MEKCQQLKLLPHKTNAVNLSFTFKLIKQVKESQRKVLFPSESDKALHVLSRRTMKMLLLSKNRQ